MKVHAMLVIAAAVLAGGCASDPEGWTSSGTPVVNQAPKAPTRCNCAGFGCLFNGCGVSEEEEYQQRLQEVLGARTPRDFTSWSTLPPITAPRFPDYSYQYDVVEDRVGYQQAGDLITSIGTGVQGRVYRGSRGLHYETDGALHSTYSIARWESGSSRATLSAVGQPGLDLAAVAWGRESERSQPSPFIEGKKDNFELVANPYRLGWDYQSFGVWNDHDRSSAIQANSYGAATPASAVPMVGSATFKGKLGGLYVSPAGQGSVAAADLAVQANFATRSLALSSSGTVLTRNLSTATVAPHLDLGGTLQYAPGSNRFSGTLSNAGGTMSGGSTGQFYGPGAQELGGVFTLKSASGVETFAGAYGAKR